jgi:hypothetical protein
VWFGLEAIEVQGHAFKLQLGAAWGNPGPAEKEAILHFCQIPNDISREVLEEIVNDEVKVRMSVLIPA